MKLILRYLQAVLLFCCMLPGKAFTQTTDYVDSKEKVYLQTNHVFFKQGEDVFFKIYVVNAKDQTPSQESAEVKVDIVSPAGTVIRQMKYSVYNGYAEGSFTFEDQAPGGIYKIKAYTSWMQNEKEGTFFVKEITLQKVIAPRVLMKLDFPKKGYGPGDEITADYEMRNLANQPVSNYEASYQVHISGVAVHSGSFKTGQDGKYRLLFRLPADLKSNDGLLNITVRYNAYTEAISRSIPITLNKIDLQFMPEGGTQVNGIANNIAFRALDENGKPVDIKGEIHDDNDNKVAVFESYKFGMGKFVLTPQNGRVYSTTITSQVNNVQQFRLPGALDEGIVLNINRENGRIRIKITSTRDQQIRLTGYTKNASYYNNAITLKKGEQIIDIAESTFPAGIARFTVFSGSNLPLAERICFLNGNSTVHASITTDKACYQPREKVTMTLKTVDEKGIPVPANFSLAVVDDKLWTLADDKQDHIVSWLLMSSELQGKIEEPQFYFRKTEEKSATALDLVMLTHGYRYFDFIPYVQSEHKLMFLPNQHRMLSGVILDSKQRPVKANVYLLETDHYNARAVHMQTGDDGSFFFSGIAPDIQYMLIAQALKKREIITIKMLGNDSIYSILSGRQVGEAGAIPRGAHAPAVPKNDPVEPGKEAGKEQTRDKRLNGLLDLDNNISGLDEVVVIAYSTTGKRLMTGSITTVRKNEYHAGSADLNAVLNGRIPGLSITPAAANPAAEGSIIIRGSRTLASTNTPLFVVDGIPVAKTELNVHPDNIESITVLKDAAATAIYGSRGADGVILVTTRQSNSPQIRVDLTKSYYYATMPVRPAGNLYTVAKKFYIPKYRSTNTDQRNDLRETIYWNPVVQTNKNGEAKVEFYNSDATTTFRAIAEGIGYNGKMGRAETTYVAQSIISVDAKIPPYLTVGDKVQIPVVVKNNSQEARLLAIGIVPPAGMNTGSRSREITLPPGGVQQILIPAEVTAAVKGEVRIITTTEAHTETLVLPVEADEKGFLMTHTSSGNRSAGYDFNIGKVIPGSLKASLKLYKDITGRLTDDIAAMLKAPYGCFEQTSSTTYPNIFILKYLRETGKSNPAIEKKAADYLESGYRRLISFETRENGFEWFGHTPAHEPLTAYGLLEFTDMQEFINVDKEMLRRTKDFLLKRRNGKGGFRISSGAYHFHAIPENVANVYIVYAMTQAGHGNDIQREYKAAMEKALDCKDGYELSLAALSASNMKDEENFAKLMERLAAWYKKNDFKAGSSLTGSGGASLQVELQALYALALMRETPCKMSLVAEIISRILNARSYYGYGATQSTVLALNALIQYSRLAGAASASQVGFALNGSSVAAGNEFAGSMKEGNNTFTVHYENEKEAIPYNFEVSYKIFNPPNSPEAEMKLSTSLSVNKANVGETVRMQVAVTNEKPATQSMTIAMIGIPAGLSAQPWQLKELVEKNQVAYYEIFDNYLVLYWRGFEASESKRINLDLKAEVPGSYMGKAGNTYLYYTPEYKHWNDGLEIEIQP